MGKLETHGYRGWWPMLTHRRKCMDGTMIGRECFVDMRNGKIVEPEDGWSTKDLPYATGEQSSLQHQGDAFRENFDRIDWSGAELETPGGLPPEVEGRRKYVGNYDNIRWD
ncbi:MAG: hypothetical protein ACOZF2_11345 [Thermodesulfobacteriota bacterium]